jgi:hypothetical protein
MILVDHPYRKHLKFLRRLRGHDRLLGLRPDEVHQHHRQSLGLHRLGLRHQSLDVSPRNQHRQGDLLRLDRLDEKGHRHRPDDLLRLDRLDEKGHRHRPGDPDLRDPFPVKVRMDCYRGVKLGAECPFPEPRRMDCCRGAECLEPRSGVRLGQCRLPAFLPQVCLELQHRGFAMLLERLENRPLECSLARFGHLFAEQLLGLAGRP